MTTENEKSPFNSITNNNLIIPVILCGGVGSRLFPLSRNNYPKQFIKIINEYSLLQNTIIRFKDYHEIILIANLEHKYIITFQLEELFNKKILSNNIKINIILEPCGRNTGAALNMACIMRPKHKLIFVPSDHVFSHNEFDEAIKTSTELLSEPNINIITLGIICTYPDTGYGYILCDINKYDESRVGGFIEKFIEKPNEELAKKLYLMDNSYWNSGIYFFNSEYVLPLFEKYMNHNHNTLLNLKIFLINEVAVSNDHVNFIYLGDDYQKCENISIDYGLIEHLDSNVVYMVPFNGFWSDIGSYKAIHSITDKDDNNISKGNIISNGSSNCYVSSSKLVTLNGVNNLGIIETEDVLLITDLDKTQNIKNIYEDIKIKNKSEINNTITRYFNVGITKKISSNNNYKSSLITIFPYNVFNINTKKNPKHILITKGKAIYNLNKEIKKGDYLCIDTFASVSITTSNEELEFIRTTIYN